MSELPKVTGHSCWTAGGPSSSSWVFFSRSASPRGLFRFGGLHPGSECLLVQLLAELVDGRAVCRIPDVVPDGRAVRAGGGRVDVVAEELGGEVVLR